MKRREAGRDLRVLFPEDGRVLEVTADGEDPAALADALIEAIGTDDPDEAERVLRSATSPETRVERIS